MKQFSALVLCLALAMHLSACQQKSEGVLVTVGSETITEADLDLLAKVNPRLQRRLSTDVGRKQVLENYVEQELLSQEAKKRGLDKDETVRAKIDLYKKVILAQSLLEDELNQAAKAYFDENNNDFQKVKIAHLYVPFKTAEKNPALDKDAKVTRSEAEAKKRIEEAKNKLKEQEFAEVVKVYSEDERTNGNGGDLGWVSPDDIRLSRWGWAPIVGEVLTLKSGDISNPIKTMGGYHLVLIEEPVKKDDFEQAQPRIRFTIQQEVKNDLVNALREKYSVEIAESEAPSAEMTPDSVKTPDGLDPAAANDGVSPTEEAAHAE